METHEHTSSCAITQTKKKRDANVRVAENITVHSQSKSPAGKDAVSAGGSTPAATLEARPLHSAASALFYLFTSPRSYHAFDYLIILHSA